MKLYPAVSAALEGVIVRLDVPPQVGELKSIIRPEAQPKDLTEQSDTDRSHRRRGEREILRFAQNDK